MVNLLICLLISLVAHECNGYPFDTIFTYITIAMQLYEGCSELLKKYKIHQQKTYQNTYDTSTKPDKVGASYTD